MLQILSHSGRRIVKEQHNQKARSIYYKNVVVMTPSLLCDRINKISLACLYIVFVYVVYQASVLEASTMLNGIMDTFIEVTKKVHGKRYQSHKFCYDTSSNSVVEYDADQEVEW